MIDSFKSRRVTFSNVWLTLPDHWRDITATLPKGTPPTLAVETGVGALQFSVAKYASGDDPDIDAKALERLLYEFEDAHGLERSRASASWEKGRVFGLSCDYPTEVEFIRVWYCSDTRNVAFITFVSGPVEHDKLMLKELDEADFIVRSLLFEE